MRKTVRHYRYRPRRRRQRAVEIALGSLAAVMLLLAAGAGIRSWRTARLNASLAALHAESGAPADSVSGSVPAGGATPLPEAGTSAKKQTYLSSMELSHMGLPDGSELSVPEGGTEAGTPVFHRIGTLDSILADMAELKRLNRDTVGWISISGVVNLPVVYRDNEYYLNHDFQGQKSGAGTLFLDQNHPLTAETQNLLIHGHNMKDGSMFGMLTRYTDRSWLQSHALITFSTLWEKELYQIFAVVRVSSGDGRSEALDDYAHPAFPRAESFQAYITGLRRRASLMEPLDLQPDDAFLTLSTCIDDDRLVLVSRRVRP